MKPLVGNFRITENGELMGWARDPDADHSLVLELAIDGRVVDKIVADQPRPDLAAKHSFTRVGIFSDLAGNPALRPGCVLTLVEAQTRRPVPPGQLKIPEMRKTAVAPALSFGKEGTLRISRTRHGVMLLNAKDSGVDCELIELGEYAETEVAAMCAALGNGSCVIDVGANIGALTLPLAAHVNGRGKVYSYEPQPNVFHRLCANLALNGITNVVTRNLAVGATAGIAHIPVLDYGAPHCSGGIRLAFAETGMSVPIVALDEEDFGGASVDLIKIDVEGYEAEVVEGAAGVIARDRPTVYVECRSRAAFDRIRAVLGKDYRFFWHAAQLYDPGNFAGSLKDRYHGAGVNSNILAIARSLPDLPADLMPMESEDEFWPAARFPAELRDRVSSWERSA